MCIFLFIIILSADSIFMMPYCDWHLFCLSPCRAQLSAHLAVVYLPLNCILVVVSVMPRILLEVFNRHSGNV